MNELIKEKIKEEYSKCRKDPEYFIYNYCKIQHPMRGKIPFKLYPFQKEVLHNLFEHRFNICLKSRQLGISTLAAAYCLEMIFFQDNKNVLIIATKQEVAKNLVSKVRYMFKNLPKWMIAARRIKILADNKTSLELSNGSVIKASAATDDAGRSEALSLLVIDEAAFAKNIRDIWTAAYSTLSTGGRAFVLSTPNGVGNWFHEQWMDWESNPNTMWNGMRLHWTVHPERDQQWREEQTSLLGPAKAGQECDCDFLTSGYTLVEGEVIQWYEKETTQDPLEMRGVDKSLWIWNYPNYSKDYIVSADVARGDGDDYSAFQVIDVETLEQVAEYQGKIGTKEYGRLLTTISTEYNNALLVVENANIGWAVLQEIIDTGYQNVYYSYKEDGYLDEKHWKRNYDFQDKTKMTPGWTTSSKTRPLIISKFELHCREKNLKIRSKRTIKEMFTFVWEGGRAQARQGKNDDIIMSWCIGLWVRDTALKLRQQGIELNKMAMNHITKKSPIFTNNNTNATNAWKMTDQSGNDWDLTEIL